MAARQHDQQQVWHIQLHRALTEQERAAIEEHGLVALPDTRQPPAPSTTHGQQQQQQQHNIGEALSLQKHYEGPTRPVGFTLFTLLRVVTTLVTVLQLVILALLLWQGAVHMQMFTYWHQIMFTVFLVALTVSLFVEGWPLAVTILVLLPLETGLTLIVSIAVVILIRENPSILLKGTTCEGGKLSMSSVHTGDFLVHDLGPLALYGALFVAGLWLLGRTVIGQTWAHMKSPAQRVLFVGWFLLSPLLPLFVYSVTLGIHKHYPTNVPDVVLWLALLPIELAVQGVVWLSFVLDANVTVNVPLLSEEIERMRQKIEAIEDTTLSPLQQPTTAAMPSPLPSASPVILYAPPLPPSSPFSLSTDLAYRPRTSNRSTAVAVL